MLDVTDGDGLMRDRNLMGPPQSLHAGSGPDTTTTVVSGKGPIQSPQRLSASAKIIFNLLTHIPSLVSSLVYITWVILGRKRARPMVTS